MNGMARRKGIVHRRMIGLLGSLLTLLCSASVMAAPPPDVRVAIETVNQQLMSALARRDSAAIAKLYTEDGQVLPPNKEVIAGHQSIAQFWQGIMDSGIRDVELKTVEVVEHDDTAYEVGNYAIKGEKGGTLALGKYVVIWMWEEGQWKLHRDIWNSSRPAAEP